MKASLWKKTCPDHPSALVYAGHGGRRCMECNTMVVPDDEPDVAPAAIAPETRADNFYQYPTPSPVDALPNMSLPNATDMSALSLAKYSLGQFVTDGQTRSQIYFPDEQKIDLFGYGGYDVLPIEAGFPITFPPRTASRDATNCRKEGALCASSDAYWIVGLAARVGQAYMIDGGPTPEWIGSIDNILRERIAESVVVDLLYKDRCCQYELGTLVQRPLNGAVFGPKVTLEAEPVIDEAKLFVPFKIPAMDTLASRVSIRLTIGRNISVSTPCSAPWRVAVPVKIWLFGHVVSIPEPVFCCVLPRGNYP